MYCEDFIRTFQDQFPDHQWKNVEVNKLNGENRSRWKLLKFKALIKSARSSMY